MGDAASSGGRRATAWLLAGLVVVSLSDIFRLGFFADDFVFLDAWRSAPWHEVLLGQHGVWPWYRPLSRELYFGLASWARHAGPAVAHAISLLGAIAATLALRQVVARRLGAVAGAVAAALFATHALTHFLAGWPSGFQDLLAQALLLGALALHQRGRTRAAALCAAAAVLSKEAAFLVFPLLAADSLLGERRAWTRREWLEYSGSAAAAASLHALTRLSWPAHAAGLSVPQSLTGSGAALVTAFVPWTTPPGAAGAWVWGASIAAAVFAWLVGARALRESGPGGPARFAPALAGFALGLLPGGLAHFTAGATMRAHFFYTALPWACALGGAASARWLAPRVVPPALALTCAVLVWTGGARTVDLDAPAGWDVGPLAWSEAQRIEARTRRLEGDLQQLLEPHAESLAVVYLHVPSGGWFQTGDGPATRAALDDATVQGFMAGEVPKRITDNPRRPIALLDYDPIERHRLVRLDAGTLPATVRAVTMLLAGNVVAARVVATAATRADRVHLLPRYVLAIATLAEGGSVSAFQRHARTASGDSSSKVVDIGAGDPRADAAFAPAFGSPSSAGAHRAAADALSAAGVPILEALELSVALRLDSTRAADALRLGRLLAPNTEVGARWAYGFAAAASAPPAIADSARREMESLERR